MTNQSIEKDSLINNIEKMRVASLCAKTIQNQSNKWIYFGNLINLISNATDVLSMQAIIPIQIDTQEFQCFRK